MEFSDKRQAILEAANHLFEIQGFNGTGVDQIASESGVTKRTLYKHFGSKEGLIASVLQSHHETMMASMRHQICRLDTDGRGRLMAFFDSYRFWFGRPNFAGCIFMKTLNELTSCSADLCRIAQAAKAEARSFIFEIAKEAGAADPALLADQLQILLEGSVAVAQYDNGFKVIDTAKSIAEHLVTAALS